VNKKNSIILIIFLAFLAALAAIAIIGKKSHAESDGDVSGS
jgi:hypothetical protein